MKRILSIFVISIFVFVAQSKINAASITMGASPTVNTGIPALDTEFNTNIAASWTQLGIDINNEILSKWDGQDKLAKGLGNATAFSTQAANLDGYQGYDLFAIMFGFGVGAQAPSTNVDELKNTSDVIEQEGDIYAGLGVGAAINVGLNASFLVKNLYINAKFGSYKDKYQDYNGKFTTFGIGLNYNWLQERSIVAGLLKWRGISFGTGFLYNHNEVDLTVGGLQASENVGVPVGAIQLEIFADPDLTLGYEATTYTIPLDINTSVRLLWLLNFNIGAGVDFIFGSTDINIEMPSSVYVKDAATGTDYTATPGNFVVDASTKDVAPSFVRPRVMAGVGICLGPVTLINASVTWYLPDGAFVGLSAGIVW